MKSEWVHFLQNLTMGQKKQVPDHIWNEVSKHLPQKPRRRILIPLLWFLTGMLLSSGLIYLWLPNQQLIKGSFETANHKATRVDHQLDKNDQIQAIVISDHEMESTSSPTKIINNHPTEAISKRKLLQKNVNRTNNQAFNFNEDENNIEQIFGQKDGEFTTLRSKEVIEESSDRTVFPITPYLPVHPGLVSMPHSNSELPEVKLSAGGKTDCYQFGKQQTEWGLEVYTGPSYSPYQLKDKQDGLRTYIDKRKSTESIRPGLMAGIRLVYQRPSWALKLGLEYQLFYEQLNYRNPNETKIISYYRNGKLLYIDTLNGDRVVKHHNYHHLLNVPLMFHFSKKWKSVEIGIQPGVGVNIWSSHQGRILDLQNEPSSFESTNGVRVFDKKIIPYLSFHIPISAPISSHLFWFVEPGFQYYLKPFSTDAYPLEQSYLSYQVRLGIRMNF
ncbi:MAG: hypothetical protein IPM92_02335 [Saprospiraceae bacterium]|nr:hypothetical protein [Saprospiraceae bacterium]